VELRGMTVETGRPVFRVSILAIMLFQVCALFARSTLELFLVSNGSDRAVANDLSYLVVPVILAALLYPYLRQHWHALASLFRPCQLTLRLCFLSLLLGFSMRVTYWAILTVLIRLGLIKNDDPGAIVGPILGFGCPPLLVLGLSFFVMALLVPIVEEVINRGFLLHALLRKGAIMSVGLSACLFAIAHRTDTYLVAFVAGLFFGAQVLNSRTLWAPLLTHAAYNASATFHWDCFQIIWNPPASDPGLAAVTRVAAPVAVLGTLICCLLVSKRAIGARPPRSPELPD
jgi:membrane protease YdiL (CAAX protease family)